MPGEDVEYRVLGPLEVRVDSRLLPLGGPKHRTLLAMLLLEANRVVAVHRLVAAIWGQQPPATATTQVQSLVSGLRRALADYGAARVIVTRPPGYLIQVQPGQLDLEVFDQRCAEAREALVHHQLEPAAAAFASALALWRGPALADVPGQVAEAVATRLAERRLVVLEERLDTDLALGRHTDLVAELTTLVAEQPMRERLRAQLMLALYRSGRQVEAMEVYRQTRRALVDQLGVEPSAEPSAELQRLHQAILTADTSLALAAPPRADLVGPPAQLPRDVADFTGRTKQISQVRDLLTPQDHHGEPHAVVVCAIAGPAGVGKTALAVHVAHQLRVQYPDGQLFANLRGAEPDPLPAAEVLGAFLRALAVDATQLPDDVEQRAALYRSRLAGRRMLVVLDNAANEAQVDPLLPGVGSCAVLVTSRRRFAGLPGARLVELDVLEVEVAAELVARIVGPERAAAEREATEEIVRLCGYLPLAVRIAAARLAARPHWSLSRMAALLADEQRRLDELQFGDMQVRASVTLSYHGLNATAQRAFRCLGLLDAGDFASWMVAAVLDVDVERAEQVLDALVDAQLLEVAGHGQFGQIRYRLHDLIWLYAREQADAHGCAGEGSAALARLINACRALVDQANQALFGEPSWIAHGATAHWCPGPGVIGALLADPSRWFETERSNLVAVVNQGAAADLGEGVWQLADSLIYFVHQRGQVHLPSQANYWQHSHQAALAAARRVGDRRGEAVLLLGLALLDTFQRHFTDARAALGLARAVFVELDDRHGEALVTFGVGVVQALAGQWHQAYQNVHAALTMFRKLAHLSGQATAECSIGRVYLEQGCLGEASAHFGAAVQLFRRSGHRTGEALALDWLGQAHRRQECLDEATSCFRQCELIADALGDPILGTRALLGLAEIDIAGGCPHRAEAAFQRGLDVSRQVGYRGGEALALDGLGRLCLDQGRAGAAVSYLTQSVGIMQSVGALQDVPMQSLLADTLRRLGEAQAAMGAAASTKPPRTHTRS